MRNIEVKHVHEFAQFLHNRADAKGFIVFGVPVHELVKYYGQNTIFYFLKEGVSLLDRHKIKRHFPHAYFVRSKDISETFLIDKIYISLRKTKNNIPSSLFENLRDCCLLSIIESSGPNTEDVDMLGSYVSDDGDTLRHFEFGGKIGTYSANTKPVSALAITPVYNEVDIVGHTVKHLLNQGLDVHLVDDWSNDGTYELIKALKKDNPKRVSVSRSPKEIRGKHNWNIMLAKISRVANESNYDWVMFNDADELRISPWQGVRLKDAFSFADAAGFNAVDFTVFDYRPVKDGFSERDSPQQFFTYGEFGTRPAHFVQIKAWKNNKEVDLAKTGGHSVEFDGRRVFPLKFLLQHYPLRSTAQAQKKLLKDRLPRLKKELLKKGWHGHYLRQSQQETYIYDPKKLVKTTPQKKFFKDYLIQRLSGVGLREDS